MASPAMQKEAADLLKRTLEYRRQYLAKVKSTRGPVALTELKAELVKQWIERRR